MNLFAMTILLVDDSDLTLVMMSHGLKSKGFLNVITCTTPLVAREIIKTTKIHVLITDMFMPEESGADLASALLDYDQDLHVIFMSASEILMATLKLMDARCITKPVRIDRLIGLLTEIAVAKVEH